ncbi:MAG: ATP-binding protein [bacterium]|nr:ATP-binding protein [bacterium]
MLNPSNPATKKPKGGDEELIALVEAFQFFNKSTVTLNQAYNRLEKAAESLAAELEQANLKLQEKNLELDRANRYLEDILSSVDSGVIVVDLEGRITIFNRTAEDMTGYTGAEVLGGNYHDFLTGEMGNDAPLLRTLLTGQPTTHLERELPLKGGGSTTVKSSSAWVTSTAGERIGVIETLEDFSQVRSLERQMLQQKTLAALGEMAAQVAHELRNPLAGIKGFAGLLLEDLPPHSKSHKMARRIIEGVDSLDRIASNLLILTQDCPGEFRRQRVEPIFEQAIGLIEIGADGQASVKRDFPAEPCAAKVDAEKLKQLLLNLMKNSWEAAEEQAEMVAGYRYNLLANEIRLFVRDFGPGVATENAEKIFSPFFSTKIQGTGLGLAIVRKIVELHHGSIECSSPEGGGAQFTAILPII